MKIMLTLNSFFTVGSFFDEAGYAHDYVDGAAIILGKEGSDPCFTFKADAFLDSEGLGEVK